MPLKTSSAKRRPLCLGLNALKWPSKLYSFVMLPLSWHAYDMSGIMAFVCRSPTGSAHLFSLFWISTEVYETKFTGGVYIYIYIYIYVHIYISDIIALPYRLVLCCIQIAVPLINPIQHTSTSKCHIYMLLPKSPISIERAYYFFMVEIWSRYREISYHATWSTNCQNYWGR